MEEEYVSVPKSKLLKFKQGMDELNVLLRKLKKDIEKLKKEES